MEKTRFEKNSRAAQRAVRRLACEIHWGEKSLRAVVLNVSATGLFVRSNSMPPLDSPVHVRIRRPGGELWEIETKVVRSLGMQEAPAWSRGVGLAILTAPPEYDEFVYKLTQDSAIPEHREASR